MTQTLTTAVTEKRKPPAKESFRSRLWRRLLYSMTYMAAEQFVDGAMWNPQARESYLNALKGDRYALQAEGSAGQSKE